jgi:hypothetical protein
MRIFLLTLFLFLFIAGYPQSGIKKDSGDINLIINDSEHIRLQQVSDSLQEEKSKREAAEDIKRLSEQSAGQFAQLSKERRAKEKRNAMIRIGIGVAFFILLIVGLRRRQKIEVDYSCFR